VIHPVEVLLALVAAALVCALLARHFGLPEPVALVIGGLLIGLQPWVPGIQLDPQIVFLLFLPPLLYAAAFRTEWPEFRAQLRAISLLAVGLVLFTMACVAAT
jgi:monovalent cation/hydrogen antiporter